MLPRSHWVRFLLLGVLAIGGVFLAAACGDDNKKEPAAPTATAQAGETPPATIDISDVPELDDGMLTVGSDIAYAPIEYYEEGTQDAKGMDVDLMAALAAALGVDFEFKQVADFGAIVLDLNTERYDVVMSAISITPERSAEIDFVPYFGPVATGILVPAGNPKGIAAPEDLCGLRVAAQVGTIQVDQVEGSESIQGLNETLCADNQITLTTFPDNPTAVQELSLGRVDAELADDPVAAYSASQSDDALEVAISRFPNPVPYGIGVRMDSAELNAVLEQALQQIISDGTYLEILTDWGQQDFALARD